MALAKYFDKFGTPKTAKIDDTHEYLSKMDESVYNVALFFSRLCPTIPTEDAFFVIQEIEKARQETGEVDSTIKDNFRNFFILQKLAHADAVSDSKGKMRRFFEARKQAAIDEYNRMLERQEMEETEFKQAQITGRQARHEAESHFNTFLANPSAKNRPLTRDEISMNEMLVKAFGKELEVAKIGWFSPRWQFRDPMKANETLNKILRESPEHVEALLKYGSVSTYRRFSNRHFRGSIEYGI